MAPGNIRDSKFVLLIEMGVASIHKFRCRIFSLSRDGVLGDTLEDKVDVSSVLLGLVHVFFKFPEPLSEFLVLYLKTFCSRFLNANEISQRRHLVNEQLYEIDEMTMVLVMTVVLVMMVISHRFHNM